MSKELNEEISALLKTCCDHFNREDQSVRERQLRNMRRLKLYWNSFSQIYWSETAKDYKIFGQEAGVDSDQSYYDRPVNVFRAFLETIIAALSIQIPAVSCVPDDADNPLDLSTAKAGDKIAEQVYKHNDVMFLWLHALYIFCTEGMVACYSYSKSDKSYGTYQKKNFRDEEVESFVCPVCQSQIPDEAFVAKEMNEFQPGDGDALLHETIQEEGPTCAECGSLLDPALQKTKLIIPRLVGITDEPKSRVCLEVYGGLYVKVANYAKNQAGTPYLRFAFDTHYTNALESFPNLKVNFPRGDFGSVGANDFYEQQARQNTQYRGEQPEENVTVSQTWLRTAAFQIHDDENYKKLKKLFPDGVRVAQVNDVVAEYENEALDDCWTLTQNPVSDFINHEPLGELITNIQDIINDLISLTLQTIEHGISQTYADPAVVDFGNQRQIEAMPGTLTPTKPLGGSRNVGEAFFSSKTAALAPEVFQFFRIVQELGQFVSGALPSLFGGQQSKGSSKTASEYAMSRAGAQQRLQTPWKMLTIWWKTIFGKVIPIYMKNLQEDERIVEKDTQGNFVNVFLRKAEMEGKIGSVELEASEHLPISDEQQKEVVMKLMELNNEEIMQALISPENLPMIRKLIKIPQFKLPGEDDRQKQYEEINVLINSEPLILPPDPMQMEEAMMQGLPPEQVQPIEESSVEVDQLVDNHEIEAAVCRSWLVSDAGRLAKIENPAGYKNVLLHMKAHMDIIQQNMMAQQEQQMMMNAQGQEQDNSGSAPPKKAKQSEKVTGDSSARNPIS